MSQVSFSGERSLAALSRGAHHRRRLAMSDGENQTPEADTGTKRAETGPSLPANSVLHIMRHAMGGEQEAITQEAVDAVQRCAGEFISFVVSEARARATREPNQHQLRRYHGRPRHLGLQVCATRPRMTMRGHACMQLSASACARGPAGRLSSRSRHT